MCKTVFVGGRSLVFSNHSKTKARDYAHYPELGAYSSEFSLNSRVTNPKTFSE